MGVQLWVVETFMNSLFKLTAQERSQVYSAANHIIENPKMPSLSIHGIDREKCDKNLLSARVSRDIRIILRWN